IARTLALVHPTVEGFPTYSDAIWGARHIVLKQEGFRDANHSVVAPQGSNRLLVIGDSYAFGDGIEDPDDRFGAVLGRALQDSTGQTWEVLHASRQDTHTLHHLAILHGVLKYRPQVVVLLYVFNDIDYLSPITRRSMLTAAPRTVWQTLHPLRLAYKNSFLFQELYVRARALLFPLSASGGPYEDSGILQLHLRD